MVRRKSLAGFHLWQNSNILNPAFTGNHVYIQKGQVMNSFLIEFLSYFFPNIANAPDWLEVFVGVILLTFFVKLIIVLIDRRWFYGRVHCSSWMVFLIMATILLFYYRTAPNFSDEGFFTRCIIGCKFIYFLCREKWKESLIMGALLTASTSFQLETLLSSATSVLTWFLTSFGSIMSFFTEHTALLAWLVVSLVGSALVYFRKLI